MVNSQIVYKRKQGYSPLQIHTYHQNNNPCLDEMISLVHISRVCFEAGLPFSNQQIKRVFNKIYVKEYYGSKSDYWKFIAKFCTSKLLVFKSENKNQKPSEKCALDPHFLENKAHIGKKMGLVSDCKGNAQECLE